MDFHHFLYWLDLLGTLAFGISGALRAMEKKMDIFGMLVLAILTASGGGILRSILIGNFPVLFLRDPYYLIVCALATLMVFYGRQFFLQRAKDIIVFDAFGLGIFTASGITIALASGMSYWASILLGIITAAFGGIMRDVLCAEVPLILRRELYATAALVGGLVYVLLDNFDVNSTVTIIVCALTVINFRLVSLKYNWSLPR
jgi:uncharacterized membrane protein YeiH